MGWVKVPVSFVGEVCEECEYEAIVGFGVIEKSNFCELFQEEKREGERCSSCLRWECMAG